MKTISFIAALGLAGAIGFLEGRRLRTLEIRQLELWMEQLERLQREHPSE